MSDFDIQKIAAEFIAKGGRRDGGTEYRVDANEAALFGRQLEVVLAKAYDIKYLANKARTLVPFNTSVDNGAQQVTYRQFDHSGSADFVDDMSKDFPRVQIKGAEYSQGFASIGVSYGYSVQEWRSARLAGVPIDAKKAATARDAIERKIESVAAIGDTTHNMTGIANAPNVPILTVSGGSGLSDKIWLPAGGGTTATPAEIFSDLAVAASSIFTLTKTIHEADTVVFPTKLFSYIKSTLFQPLYSTQTILGAILAANPWIKHVDNWVRLDTAGADGKGRALVYKRDPEIAELFLSQDFEQFPPQMSGLELTVNCHARMSGVQVRFPKAMCYIDGLQGSVA